MKVSVVIPSMNEEKYIDATLYHISKQKPYEIIVADYRSKDRTCEIAKSYGCRVLHLKKKFPSAARNEGSKAAKGDIILYLDADTIAFENLIETVKRDFETKDIAGWTCKMFGFSHSFKEQIPYSFINVYIKFIVKYLKKAHIPGVAVAIRKDIFNKTCGFDERLRIMEDIEFFVRIGKLGRFHYSDDTCVFTSTRRVKKWGWGGSILRYPYIYLRYLINKDGFIKDHREIAYEHVR